MMLSETFKRSAAKHLASEFVDLGDEREVERELIHAGFWPDDVRGDLSHVIDTARALRADAMDLEVA